MDGGVLDIFEHGIWIWIDEKKGRIQCNHCKEEMNSLHSLKCHIGGVRGNVTPCEQVPSNVREMFWKTLMEEKAAKEIGELRMGIVPKRERSDDADVETEKQHLLSNKAQKCIGRFFYECGVDFSVVDSPSFKEMMTVGNITQFKIPNSHDLDGWMLQETLKEVNDTVKKIKDSWTLTGCSILVDAWVDEKGRNLVMFVADCPAGAVYLKSVDVSDITNDVAALLALVNGLVKEVGVRNVVQIIACSTIGWVGELGKIFASHDREVFWSYTVSHCFDLMLMRIMKMHSFEDVLEKVKNVWEFINNNPLALKIFKYHGPGKDIRLISSEFEFLKPYLRLESIFNAKNNLKSMFASSDWYVGEGIVMFNLINDSTFWETVEKVIKYTSPLVHGLLVFSTLESQHVGYIYDTMDGIKENIAKEFNHKKIDYKTVWEVIDDVWSTQLYNPLHAAGYFLNPTAFYSTDFHLDSEVSNGLLQSVVHVVKERHIQIKVSAQLDKYRLGKDCFDEASKADQISGITPTEWWTQKASEYPELQSFAIKILNQTCEGASRFKLKRSLAEKLLLTEGMSHREQKHQENLTLVHYNLHLQNFRTKRS